MKKLMGSIMAIIWGGILGMLLGYIGSQLEATSIIFLHAAITGAVLAVIATYCVYAISTKANPARQK